MLLPPIKAMVEIGMDKEAFSEREIGGVPGELVPFLGGKVTPMSGYLLRNIRLLNTFNRIFWPEAGRFEERISPGERGPREPKDYIRAIRREWGGVKLFETNPQRNRYFKAYGKNSDLNTQLGQIQSKLAGDPDAQQRESYLQARTELLWEKASVLAEMIADGTDPFTGKTMEWIAPRAKQGQRRAGSLRDYYTEMFTTVRSLYFGDVPKPTDHGIFTLSPAARMSEGEIEQVYELMTRLKLTMLGKDFQVGVEKSSPKYLEDKVFAPIRDIVRTEDYYKRKDAQAKEIPDEKMLYGYPYNFRKALADLFLNYIRQAARAGVFGTLSAEDVERLAEGKPVRRPSKAGDAVKAKWNNFVVDYYVDYVEDR